MCFSKHEAQRRQTDTLEVPAGRPAAAIQWIEEKATTLVIRPASDAAGALCLGFTLSAIVAEFRARATSK